MLEVKDLSKKYKKRYGLKDFSYKFENKVYGLLGPNGAGKSTLMNILCGVLKRTAGEVLYEGKDICELKEEYSKHIGYLPQHTGLYPDFTAEYTLEYFAYLRGIGKLEIQEHIDKVLEYTNLSDRRKDKVGSFSGGMKRRLAIAITLVGDPDILVFDEPTVGLDPMERYRFKEMIKKICDDRTIIISSHIVSDLSEIADKIIIMKDSVIVGNMENEDIDIEKEYMKYFIN